MKIFFKGFELSDGKQVLLLKQYDSVEDSYSIETIMEYNGFRGSAKATFKTEEDMELEFNDFTIDKAEKFYNSMSEFFKEDNI